MLNKGQQQACDRITQLFYYARGKDRLAGIFAAGGCGKSYLLDSLVSQLGLQHEEIIVSATTHEACEAITQANKESNLPYAVTIYSVLKMIVNSDGEERYLSNAKPFDFTGIKLLIVDEVSMAGELLTKRLLEAMKYYPELFIVVVGDPDQALVVKLGLSPIFTTVPQKNKFFLTENMRQVGVEVKDEEPDESLIRLTIPKTHVSEALKSKVHHGSAVDLTVKEIKQCIRDKYKGKLEFTNEFGTKGSLITLPPARFYKGFQYYVKQDKDTKLITWTNRSCRRYNNLARQSIYGKKISESEFWLEGEKILAGNELMDRENEFPFRICRKRKQGIIVSSSQVPEIAYIREETGISLSGYRLEVDFGNKGVIYIPDEKGFVTYYNTLEDLRKSALKQSWRWQAFWEFKDLIADIRYSWAITCHASQGKTLGENVFVDMIDLNRNPNWLERLTLTNVALSRTTMNCWVNQRGK